MDASTCEAPLSHVMIEPLPEGADSLMFSMTKHRDRTCLTDDDVEGLNYLYPSCHSALDEANRVRRNPLPCSRLIALPRAPLTRPVPRSRGPRPAHAARAPPG
jgi:hypothetical protein